MANHLPVVLGILGKLTASAIFYATLAGGTCSCTSHDTATPADASPDAWITECTTDAGTFEVECTEGADIVCARDGTLRCDLPDAGQVTCCKR